MGRGDRRRVGFQITEGKNRRSADRITPLLACVEALSRRLEKRWPLFSAQAFPEPTDTSEALGL
jgi:hypothetical protein